MSFIAAIEAITESAKIKLNRLRAITNPLLPNGYANGYEGAKINFRKNFMLGNGVALFIASIIIWAFYLRDTERLVPNESSIGARHNIYGLDTISLIDLPQFILNFKLTVPIWGVGLFASALGFAAYVIIRRGTILRVKIDQAEMERRLARNTAQSLQLRMEEKIRTRTAELEMSYRVRDDLSKQVQTVTQILAAQEKMAALGRVVAGIAHEINTPIGVAVTASSLLAQNLAKMAAEHEVAAQDGLARPRQLVGIIEQALTNAAHKIKSFKQVAADQHLTTPRRLDLINCLNDCANSLQPMVIRRGHKFHIIINAHQENYDPALPNQLGQIWLTTRPDALWQVLSNLVGNALLHGFGDDISHPPSVYHSLSLEPKRTGTITISCQIEPAPALEQKKSLAVISIQDDGVGMSEEIRAQIFEPFFTTKRGQGGTGLGLSICHNLVTTSLNGRIECESKPNHGTIFRIFLPME